MCAWCHWSALARDEKGDGEVEAIESIGHNHLDLLSQDKPSRRPVVGDRGKKCCRNM